MLDRKAEAGERLMSSVQAIGILADVRVPDFPRDQIVARNIVGGPA